jgi:hypothetical protein
MGLVEQNSLESRRQWLPRVDHRFELFFLGERQRTSRFLIKVAFNTSAGGFGPAGLPSLTQAGAVRRDRKAWYARLMMRLLALASLSKIAQFAAPGQRRLQ